MAEEKLRIIRDGPNKYHFRTKDDQRVEIEHKDQNIVVDLFKWDGEASLQVVLDKVPVHNHVFTENKIEVENPDFLMRVYPIDVRSTGDFYGDSEDDVQCHDGGLRFELILKKKRPAMDNSLVFPVISKNLRFSYQPFLTQEDIDAGRSCPLNVEGSYAVYHATKKHSWYDHTLKKEFNYMTGKAFHLFRPIAEDALGVKAWCSIEFDKYIDPTSLTLTVPQQFLDEATYPITIDPDFGYTAIGGGAVLISDDDETWRRGTSWTMPAGGGTANYLRAYLGAFAGTPTPDCKAFINEEDSVAAGQHGQIATDEELACPSAAHWEEFTLAGETLTGGVDYILSVMGKICAGKGDIYEVALDTDGTGIARYEENQNYAAPESPWVVASAAANDYSIYVNYSTEPVASVSVPPLKTLIMTEVI